MLAAPDAARAGAPFITDDPEPVDPGHWEIFLFSAGAVGSNDASGFGPAIEINYGAADNLQLHVIGDIAYDDPSGGRPAQGVGDTEIGAKYRFVTAGAADWWPDIGIYPLLELPSGNPRQGLGAGHVQAFLPVWMQKTYGKWTIYGGGGYGISPGAGNRNYTYVGVVVQRQLTENFALGGEVFYQTSPVTGRNGSAGFNIGGIYDISEHYHVTMSVGHGGLFYAVDSAVRSPVTYYAALQLTF